jgi:hypothetical protein
VKQPGEIIRGMVKSLLVKFFIPVYALLFIIALNIWGNSVADDFLFGFFGNLVCFLLLALLADHYLPFSRQPDTRQQAGRFFVIMMQFLVVGALVGLHYLLVSSPFLLYALIPVLIIFIYLLLKKMGTLPWSKIAI